MRTASRLAVYGLAVAASFGAATAVGAAVGPIETVGHPDHPVSTAGHDPSASASAQSQTGPVSAYVADVDGYRVTRTAAATAGTEWALNFAVTRDGGAVHTDPYLGEPGHLVAIREADFGYLHVHAVGSSAGNISFEAAFPTTGTYRLFLDFAAGGSVHTAAFIFEVPRSASAVGTTDSTTDHGHSA